MNGESKLKRLSLGEKVEALTMLKEGCTNIAVTQKLSIKRRTVMKLNSDETKILKRAEKNGLALHTKRARSLTFPAVEEQVLTSIALARQAKMPVTQDLIQHRSLMARNELLAMNDANVEKDSPIKFSASIG